MLIILSAVVLVPLVLAILIGVWIGYVETVRKAKSRAASITEKAFKVGKERFAQGSGSGSGDNREDKSRPD